MAFPFEKNLDKYTNDELITLFAQLNQKLHQILDEGKRREMLYFLREHEQIDLLTEIFNRDETNE